MLWRCKMWSFNLGEDDHRHTVLLRTTKLAQAARGSEKKEGRKGGRESGEGGVKARGVRETLYTTKLAQSNSQCRKSRTKASFSHLQLSLFGGSPARNVPLRVPPTSLLHHQKFVTPFATQKSVVCLSFLCHCVIRSSCKIRWRFVRCIGDPIQSKCWCANQGLHGKKAHLCVCVAKMLAEQLTCCLAWMRRSCCCSVPTQRPQGSGSEVVPLGILSFAWQGQPRPGHSWQVQHLNWSGLSKLPIVAMRSKPNLLSQSPARSQMRSQCCHPSR